MTAKLPALTRFGGARFNRLGRPGAVEDVAHLAAHLLSPASAAVRGQTLRVCGGFWGGR